MRAEFLVCTAIAQSCVPWARRLARGLARHHPGARLLALVLDDSHGSGDYHDEPFDTVHPSSLDIGRFETLAAILDRRGLELVVRPALLRLTLDRSPSLAVYLGPQTELFADLGSLLARTATEGFGLVPRLSEPIPRDGLRPTDVDVANAGIFDSDIISCSESERSSHLLRTWSDRLRFEHLRGHPAATSRWHDLIATFVPGAVIADDRGVGASIWNLHERRLSSSAAGLMAGGERLRTLSFRGFDPEPGVEADRADPFSRATALIERQPVLARLLGDRLDATGRCLAYGFDSLADGTRLTPRLRELIAAAEREGGLQSSPFTTAGIAELTAWLEGPIPGTDGVTRFWLAVHRSRPDLQVAYPEPLGRDAPAFLRWVETIGTRELPSSWRWATELTPR